MAYERLNLKNGTVLTEEHLAHFEDGLEEALGEWRKAVHLKTTSDLTYINVTEDDNGKPLSFDEAFVVFTTARASTASTTGTYVMSVHPDWHSSFNKYGIYSLPLYGDAYSCAVYYKRLDDLILETLYLNKRVAGSLAGVSINGIIGFPTAGQMLGNGDANKNAITVRSRYVDGITTHDYFNSEGKMCGVTIGTDLASSVQIGAGSILEVWVK